MTRRTLFSTAAGAVAAAAAGAVAAAAGLLYGKPNRAVPVAAQAANRVLGRPRLDGDQWITVADGLVNKNGRAYSKAALESMLEGLRPRGLRVGVASVVATHIGLDGGIGIGDVLGFVREARLVGEEVHVRIDWLKPKPTGSYLAPFGFGLASPIGNPHITPYYLVTEYTFRGLEVFGASTFIYATPVA